MERHYKIGEFAKNLGVSTGFLKHHEKYGLLKPKVADSGYRYYEFHQAMLVVQCIRLQNMGFTSKEISDILNHTASADMGALFEQKKDLIEQKYHLYEEMLRYLDSLAPEREGGSGTGQTPGTEYGSNANLTSGTGHGSGAALASGAEHDLNRASSQDWCILRPEPFYYVENASCGRFVGNEDRYEIALRWNEYMPMVETCARFEGLAPAPHMDSVGNWHMGLRVVRSTAQRLNIFLNREVRLVEPDKCLVYHVHEKRKRNIDNRNKAMCLILERPLDICRKHGFSIAGDIYSVQKFCSTAQEENYIEETVMIPVDG